MKRKIFSTLLMGAFVFASLSTVTSCKDYDDDINGLQTELASLKSSVTTLQSDVATVKSDAATAKSTAETAKTTAENALSLAQNAATKADLEAAKDRISTLETKIAKLDDLQSQITELKSKLEDLEAKAATKDELKALQAEFDAIKGQFDALYQMVTSVELIGSYSNGQFITGRGYISGSTNSANGYWTSGNNTYTSHSHGAGSLGVKDSTLYTPFDLTFETKQITSADFTFGKKEVDPKKGEHSATPQATYKKNSFVNFPTEIVVRINPVNAEVDPEDVSLVDSKGNDLSKIIKVTNVKRFTTLLTRAQETGLRTISLQLQDGVKSTEVEQLSDSKHILYAVSINNTDSAATRNVVSTYDITIQKPTTYTGASSLDGVKIYSEETMGSAAAKDLKDLKPSNGDEASNVTPRGSYVIPAKSGENVVVDFSTLTKVDKFYIVRDDKYAGSSDQSELNSWKSYSYTGLNEIVDVEDPGKKSFTISIPSNLTVGDEVCFRIFAVNYDGTLVDADGESFCVYVGGQQTTASVTGEFVATQATGVATEWLPITGTLKDGVALPSSITFKQGNNTYTATVTYAKNANGAAASKNSEVKYAKFTFTGVDIKGWADGASATQIIESKDSKGLVENQISVTLTKTLPTVDYTKKLMNYSWKTNQLVDGVYTAYVYPTQSKNTTVAWTTADAKYGYKDLTQAINNLTSGFSISIANADRKTDGAKFYYTEPLVIGTSSWNLYADNAKDTNGTLLIDNTTKHETTVGYNYGKVSSASEDDYIVNVETVNTIFACPLTTDVQKYTWSQKLVTAATETTAAVYADVNCITYNQPASIEDGLLTYLTGTNSFDNTTFGGKFSAILNKYYVNAKAELISKGNGKVNEYFIPAITKAETSTISFTAQSGTTNPTADVESTLKITLTDAYGHDNVYELPFVVKRAVNAGNAKKH